MTTKSFTSLAAAGRAIMRDAKARDRRVRGTVKRVARAVKKKVAAQYVPIAFRELVDSLDVRDFGPGRSDVGAYAPHSEAVEKGSRPHTPPLQPLVRWVQLRGMQGLSKSGSVKSVYGRPRRAKLVRNTLGEVIGVQKERERKTRVIQTWRKQAGATIASALRSKLGKTGASRWLANARAVSSGKAEYIGGADPDTVNLARAIQFAIAKRGTKPARFMERAIPDAYEYFDQFVKSALPDKGGDTGSDASSGSGAEGSGEEGNG